MQLSEMISSLIQAIDCSRKFSILLTFFWCCNMVIYSIFYLQSSNLFCVKTGSKDHAGQWISSLFQVALPECNLQCFRIVKYFWWDWWFCLGGNTLPIVVIFLWIILEIIDVNTHLGWLLFKSSLIIINCIFLSISNKYILLYC